MSTLVVLGVVLVAIAGVLHLALDQPDQPATARPRSGRGRRRPGRRPAAAEAAPRMVAVGIRPASTDDPPLQPALVDISTPAATRVRSAVTLMMLVAVLGVAVALFVAAVIVGAAKVVGGGVA